MRISMVQPFSNRAARESQTAVQSRFTLRSSTMSPSKKPPIGFR